MLAHVRADRARRRRLPLDPERAHAGAEGRRALRHPWHVREYRPGSTGRSASATSPASTCSGFSTPASCAPTSSRCDRTGGPRAPSRPARHEAVLRPLHAGDLGARLHAAAHEASTARSTWWRCCGPEAGSASSCTPTDMPYVEGFGTWPFGEEWLWEAIATSYLPSFSDVLDAHPGKVTLSITPGARRPARGAGRARALPAVPARRPARVARARPARRADCPRSSTPPPATPLDALERRGDLIAAFAPHVSWTSAATHAVLPLLATDAGVRLQLESGDRGPPAALRRLARRLLAARVRARAVARRAARGGRRARRRASTGPTSRAAVPLREAGRDARRRSTARRSTASGTTRGYPSHGDYRDTHRLTPRAHQAWANDGTPYDPERGAARARAHAREFVDALDGDSVVAFDTELFGHFWHEGRDVAGGVCCELGRCRADRARRTAAGARRAADELGRRRATCARGAPAPTARVDAAQRRAGRARRATVAARAARAAGAAELRLGVPDHQRRPPATTPANAPPRHHEAFASRARAATATDALRNLAPELAGLGVRPALELKVPGYSADVRSERTCSLSPS